MPSKYKIKFCPFKYFNYTLNIYNIYKIYQLKNKKNKIIKMFEKVNTISRKQRLSLVPFAYNNVLEYINSNNTEKMSEFILSQENKIWEIKLSENLTLLHNACATDKTDIIITLKYPKKKNQII